MNSEHSGPDRSADESATPVETVGTPPGKGISGEHAREPMIHVTVGWDADYEAPYVHESMEGESEDRSDAFEGDIPERLWLALQSNEAESRHLIRTICEAVGFDHNEGRMAVRCPQWEGDEYPGQTWYQISLAASGSEDTWPVIDAVMGHHKDLVAAEQQLTDLPDEFWMSSGHQLVRVEKERLSIERKGYGGSAYACRRCGWSKAEHAASSGGSGTASTSGSGK